MVKITLQLDSPRWVAGKYLTGSVILYSNRKTHVTDVSVQLVGVEKGELSGTVSKVTVFPTERIQHVDARTTAAAHPRGKRGGLRVEAGRHPVPFSLLIPLHAPPTYHYQCATGYAAMAYKLHARVRVPFGFDAKAETKVIVGPAISGSQLQDALNHPVVLTPSRTMVPTSTFCCGSKLPGYVETRVCVMNSIVVLHSPKDEERTDAELRSRGGSLDGGSRSGMSDVMSCGSRSGSMDSRVPSVASMRSVASTSLEAGEIGGPRRGPGGVPPSSSYSRPASTAQRPTASTLPRTPSNASTASARRSGGGKGTSTTPPRRTAGAAAPPPSSSSQPSRQVSPSRSPGRSPQTAVRSTVTFQENPASQDGTGAARRQSPGSVPSRQGAPSPSSAPGRNPLSGNPYAGPANPQALGATPQQPAAMLYPGAPSAQLVAPRARRTNELSAVPSTLPRTDSQGSVNSMLTERALYQAYGPPTAAGGAASMSSSRAGSMMRSQGSMYEKQSNPSIPSAYQPSLGSEIHRGGSRGSVNSYGSRKASAPTFDATSRTSGPMTMKDFDTISRTMSRVSQRHSRRGDGPLGVKYNTLQLRIMVHNMSRREKVKSVYVTLRQFHEITVQERRETNVVLIGKAEKKLTGGGLRPGQLTTVDVDIPFSSFFRLNAKSSSKSPLPSVTTSLLYTSLVAEVTLKGSIHFDPLTYTDVAYVVSEVDFDDIAPPVPVTYKE